MAARAAQLSERRLAAAALSSERQLAERVRLLAERVRQSVERVRLSAVPWAQASGWRKQPAACWQKSATC
jgi:hypothetical protein